MYEVAKNLLLLLVGALITFGIQRLLHTVHEKTKKVSFCKLAFRGHTGFHNQVFGIEEEVWRTKFPPHLRDSAMTYVFFVESSGRGTITDLRIRIDAKNGSGIGPWQFQVDSTVKCERLTTTSDADKRLVATCKYLNPGEQIVLYLIAAAVKSESDIEIGVDGEGVTVAEGLFLEKMIETVLVAGQRLVQPNTVGVANGKATTNMPSSCPAPGSTA